MSNVRMAFDGGRTRSPIADALATGPRVLKIWLNNRLLNKGYCPILVRAYHFLCTTYKVSNIGLKKLEKVSATHSTQSAEFLRGILLTPGLRNIHTLYTDLIKRPQNNVLNRTRSRHDTRGAMWSARPPPRHATAPLTAARGDTC